MATCNNTMSAVDVEGWVMESVGGCDGDGTIEDGCEDIIGDGR